jgi:hypothetical protein
VVKVFLEAFMIMVIVVLLLFDNVDGGRVVFRKRADWRRSHWRRNGLRWNWQWMKLPRVIIVITVLLLGESRESCRGAQAGISGFGRGPKWVSCSVWNKFSADE